MRIALVTPDYPPEPIGGAGISCALLARHLRARGHVVDVYALTGRPSQPSGGPEGSDIHLLRPATLYGRNRLAAKAVLSASQPYDIVHVYEGSLLPAARMIQDRSDVPVVAQLNNLRAACFAPEYALRYGCRCNSLLGALRTIVRDPEPSSRLRRLFYVLPAFRLAQCLARGIRQFIALSEDTKQRYVAAGFEADHIAVVPNMYDDARFAPRAPVGQEADEVEIICVGQLDHRKGVLDLAEGFADLPDDLQQKAFLSFIGRGTEEAPLRALINWLGIKRRVQVRHTAYDSLPAVYERAHVAVLPARWPEPFGRTKLEAMAFGLPVLTSDHGSAREVLGDAAQYYTPFDVEDLTDRLAELIRDADLRRRLGTAGQARLERFSPDRIVPQVLEVYRRAGSGVRDRGSGVRGPANPNSEIRHPKSP